MKDRRTIECFEPVASLPRDRPLLPFYLLFFYFPNRISHASCNVVSHRRATVVCVCVCVDMPLIARAFPARLRGLRSVPRTTQALRVLYEYAGSTFFPARSYVSRGYYHTTLAVPGTATNGYRLAGHPALSQSVLLPVRETARPDRGEGGSQSGRPQHPVQDGTRICFFLPRDETHKSIVHLSNR